jgi:hypothetical protein
MRRVCVWGGAFTIRYHSIIRGSSPAYSMASLEKGVEKGVHGVRFSSKFGLEEPSLALQWPSFQGLNKIIHKGPDLPLKHEHGRSSCQ